MHWLALKERAEDSLLAMVALACASLAMVLAHQHPVAPLRLAIALTLVLGLVARYPASWLFLLPALLPVLSFAPWTGWWLFGEWDLLVLAVLGGGYARCLWDRRGHWGRSASRLGDHSPRLGAPRIWKVIYLILIFAVVLAGWRGWVLADDPFVALRAGVQAEPLRWANLWTSAMYGDYAQAWNALRVSKGFVWALMFWPLLRRLRAHDAEEVMRLFSRGMLTGLALVCTWVVWERLAYVGLLDFTSPYRTTAGFWEMHVGGGAIDAYLAMAVPFAFWALWAAPSGWRWWGAACLAFWALYAVLTTYSRGVLGAVVMALSYLAWLAWRGRIAPTHGIRTHRLTWTGLALLLIAETVLALGGGNFLAQRLAQSDTDLRGRWAHWTAGVGLLQSPQDWLLGLGAGRLPGQYSRKVPNGEFAGQARWRADGDRAPLVVLSSPAGRPGLATDFGFAQRVRLEAGGPYTVQIRVESQRPTALLLSVCEQHLIYALRCQKREFQVPAAESRQDAHTVMLEGPEFARPSWWQPVREGLFSISAPGAGQVVHLRAVKLLDPKRRQVLLNTDFPSGTQHWFIVVRDHFQPWHIDNLYLQVLIEHGLTGLAIVAALLAVPLARLREALASRERLAGVLSASMLSGLVLGLLISITEMPRLVLMLALLLMVSSLPIEKKQPG